MAARRLQMRLPLWKRAIPKYPLYVEGKPQNRVFLCQFWMKVVRPHYEIPKDRVHFEVHPQMSKLDIKQYLEKIYNVDVLTVKTFNRPEKIVNKDDPNSNIADKTRIPAAKLAFVHLGGNHEFTFPDLITSSVQIETDMKETTKRDELIGKVKLLKNWERPNLPPWFK